VICSVVTSVLPASFVVVEVWAPSPAAIANTATQIMIPLREVIFVLLALVKIICPLVVVEINQRKFQEHGTRAQRASVTPWEGRMGATSSHVVVRAPAACRGRGKHFRAAARILKRIR
jgi:hypothetical protein